MTDFKVFEYNASLAFFSCMYSDLWNVLNNLNVVDSVLKVCIVTISDHFSSSHSQFTSQFSFDYRRNGMGCFLQYVPTGAPNVNIVQNQLNIALLNVF